tara:strand:+ start:573 stop:1430 length:858 start_codon:yes stop_codon:yes gene_type:complete
MILNFTYPAEFVAGGQMKPEHWSGPLDELESVFQSNMHGVNIALGPALHGKNFRGNGLTEVWKRAAASESWTVFPGAGGTRVDMPGGSLRFRLRRPATVVVFYIASIFRTNYPEETSGDDGTQNPPVNVDKAVSHTRFEALWEGKGDGSPGGELLQSTTVLRQRGNPGDSVTQSRQVVFAWQVRPVNGTAPVVAGTRAFPGTDQLQAGWHCVRHTASDLLNDEYPLPEGSLHTPGFVVGNTELVVVANYGPKQDDLEEAAASAEDDRVADAGLDDVRGRVFRGRS